MNAWRSLSPQQYACAMLLRDGLENSEIASKMGVSRLTVKAHLEHAYTRSGAKNRVQLALMAERGELRANEVTA